MAENSIGDTGNVSTEIAFDYIKGNFFRVVHADGVIGGPTPSGNLHVAFFSERGPIPQREVRAVGKDGVLGNLLPDQSVVRAAIVREVDFDVILSVPVAETLISWLQERLDEMRSRTSPGHNQQKG